MNVLTIGQSAPDFCLPDTEEKQICLKNFQGKWVVLYFYPKDNTSGCTLEAIHFTESLAQFKEHNAVVLGISPDSVKSHCNFRDKHDLKVTLLSDSDHTVLEAYGVWSVKKMYGKEYYGVMRSTFLIDPQGQIVEIWKKVKVPGHIETILEKLRSL
ncbi:thioredoxin-dependent thiol peroxidase [bacterium]|nr:thioredoxin-dependent thiol peroxidase [bacterium]RQV98233.1 MAG: thioredoxin-dependent thiol peroxidase [bacterium]